MASKRTSHSKRPPGRKMSCMNIKQFFTKDDTTPAPLEDTSSNIDMPSSELEALSGLSGDEGSSSLGDLSLAQLEASNSEVFGASVDAESDDVKSMPIDSDGHQPQFEEGGNLAGEMHPYVRSGDLGLVVKLKSEKGLSDAEKFYLLKHHSVPIEGYKFPSRVINGQRRSFQPNWLKKYNGLTYSSSEDGGFCLHCVLFGQCEPSVKELGTLVNKPFTNFKNAIEKLDHHFISENRKSHKMAVEKAIAFLAVKEKRSVSIDQHLHSKRAEIIATNRLKLRSIASTIIFCGRQALAFRGYDEDYFDIENNARLRYGNFLSLLLFRIDAGDEILKKHLQTAGRNAMYTSKETQSELIRICGDIIQNKILQKIRAAKFYSVIADEATDSANDEQLSISIRYVDSGSPQEKFLGFYQCTSGVTGEAIASYILEQLATWQLEPQSLRGQAYDGAGAMAGKTKGAAACISAQYPLAVYTHCAAHRLNLCVVKCCSIREINNMMDVADRVARYFGNSPKRQLALEGWIENVLQGEKRKKLKELCRTRWVERHEAFQIFSDLFLPIVSCLEDIAYSSAAGWNRESRSDAQSLLLALTQFSFIFALEATHSVLAYTRALSVKLQGPYVDVGYAHHEVENIKCILKECRSNVNSFHNQIYSTACKMGNLADVSESRPRTTSRQQHRPNIPAQSISDYFRLSVTIPLLDHLINELDTRFDEHSSLNVILFLKLLPSSLVNKDVTAESFDSLLEFYEDDLPQKSAFCSEFHLWKRKWSQETIIASDLNTPEKALPYADDDFYPNISTLLKIMASLPVTSCECERSISMLKLIKTPLRSTMGQGKLNGLALLYYHQDIELTPEEVVEEFATCNPRRMLLV